MKIFPTWFAGIFVTGEPSQFLARARCFLAEGKPKLPETLRIVNEHGNQSRLLVSEKKNLSSRGWFAWQIGSQLVYVKHLPAWKIIMEGNGDQKYSGNYGLKQMSWPPAEALLPATELAILLSLIEEKKGSLKMPGPPPENKNNPSGPSLGISS